MSGFVSLVGAGPGDPDLLTRARRARAGRRPTSCSTTRSSRPAALALAPRAQRFSVGKRAGRPSMRQETIHRADDPRRAPRQARRAPEGRRPVRLRPRRRRGAGAAPRRASRSRWCPASARRSPRPALAGIPVTHRGLASGFVVVSGHAESGLDRPCSTASRRARHTVVVLMGLAARGEIAALPARARLARRRRPAALLLAAGTPRAQHAGSGPLATLGRRRGLAGHEDAPGTIVVGDVVGLAGERTGAAFDRRREGDALCTSHAEASTLGRTRLVVRGRGRDRRVRAARSTRYERGELTPDQWRAFRLVRGTYGQRQTGDAQMLRVKIPQGILDGPQLDALADVAERYSRGFGHITTRQNVQFHFLKLHDVEPAMRRLAEAGLTTREACGSAVRNITACPYAGVAADEAFDVTPYAEALTRHLLRHPLSSTLPRKFKIAFEGCPEDHALAAINDIGLRARVHVNGSRAPRLPGHGRRRHVDPAARRASCCSSSCPRARSSTSPRRSCGSTPRCGDYKHKQRNRMKFLIREHGLGGLAGASSSARSPR